MNHIEFGNRIKQYRKIQGMKQLTLADLTGLSVGHISNIENGKSEASIETLIKISNALHVATDQLLCDSLDDSVDVYRGKLEGLFLDCSKDELKVMVDLANVVKPWMEKRSKEE